MAARNPNDVGSPGHPGADGGHQTPEQAAVIEGGTSAGRTDADRKREWSKAGDDARGSLGPGGSSQGQADRKPAD